MTTKVCEVCGASPCYLICPTQSPWANQAEEDADYEANARYDYVAEAYGPTAVHEDPSDWD